MEESPVDGPAAALPEDVIARIDVTARGARVNLRDGMPAAALAELLRILADGFEDGTMERKS